MAQRIILYWRDIPAQVIVRQGRTSAKRELPERFIMAVDRAAMRAGLRESDAYLAQWRRGTPEPCGDDLAAEVDAALADLQTCYSDTRLDALVRAGGHETPHES
jgi:Virulence factor